MVFESSGFKKKSVFILLHYICLMESKLNFIKNRIVACKQKWMLKNNFPQLQTSKFSNLINIKTLYKNKTLFSSHLKWTNNAYNGSLHNSTMSYILTPKVPIVTNQTAFYKVWQYPMFGKFLNKKIKKGAICTSNLFTNRTNL